MNNRYLILISLIIFITSIVVYTQSKTDQEPHYHAGFKIFINGNIQDYSDPKYMKVEECAVDPSTDSRVDTLHLHNTIGDVVHLHAENVTWQQLIDYLQIDLSGKQVQVFINRHQVIDFLKRTIQPYDSLVLLVANDQTKNPEKYLDQEVTKEHVISVESEPETCGR